MSVRRLASLSVGKHGISNVISEALQTRDKATYSQPGDRMREHTRPALFVYDVPLTTIEASVIPCAL